MSVETAILATDAAARRRFGATVAMLALVVLLALISLAMLAASVVVLPERPGRSRGA